MDIKIKLGLNIKKLRLSLNLSQEKFSEIININRRSLSYIERGKSFPKPETLESIHKNFKIDYSELFNFEKKSNRKLDSIINKLSMLDNKELNYIESFINSIVQNK